jgi:hypothetical protein
MICCSFVKYMNAVLVVLTVHAIVTMTYRQVLAQTTGTDDMNITIQFSTVAPHEYFNCSFFSKQPIMYNPNFFPKERLRIVSSAQLDNASQAFSYLQSFQETLNLYYKYPDNISNNIYTSTASMLITHKELGCKEVECCDVPTNVTLPTYSNTPPLQIVVVNNATNKVRGKSIPFRIAGNDAGMKLLERSYFPGEGLNIVVANWVDIDYVKIFEVTSSYKNTPLRFNSAPVVKVYKSPYFYPVPRSLIIDWTKPGLYQAVAFSRYDQIIRSISDPFTVKANTDKSKAKITVDSTSYVLGQAINTTITREDGTPYDTQIRLFIGPANMTFQGNTPTTEPFDFIEVVGRATWISRSKTIKTSGQFPWLENGRYKVYVFVYDFYSSYFLGSSPSFRVTNPIKITMPKRRYIQGEDSPFDVYMPLDLEDYNTGCTDCGYIGLAIVQSNFTAGDESEITPHVWGTRNDKIRMFPGLYRFAVVRRFDTGLRSAWFIANSTFEVVPNHPIVTTDKKVYKKGEKIALTLKTTRNIIYPETYEIHIVAESENSIQYKNASFVTDSVTNQLMTTVDVDWSALGTVVAVIDSPWYVARWGISPVWGKSASFQIIN